MCKCQKGTNMKSIDELIANLTTEEKIALVSGHNFMYTNSVSRLGIPSIRMSDGPHGLRVQNEGGDNGVAGSLPATAFPTASCSANTWNPELLEEMGKAMGEEAKYYGIDMILGPGVCIKRNPLCGRNFEYFSEDPFLAGRMGAAEVIGIQSTGTGSCIKHYALNNSENYRFMGNSVCDMRAIREIYLKQYEYIVKNAHPEAIMSAYNQINGTFCSENKWLLTDVLRNEWGFDGVVMTDWGGVKDRVLSIQAGNDLEMPGDTAICRKWLYDAIQNKTLDTKDLDAMVRNVLVLAKKHEDKTKLESIDWEKHHELAKKVALEGAVLMKNEDMLPLNKDEDLLIVGELFEKMRYQGSGSSMINPYLYNSPKNAFDNNNIKYKYVKGYKENELDPNVTLMNEALEAAKDYKKILVFAGLTDYVESEGGDREIMSLPINQLKLISELIKQDKEIIVVLYGGSVIRLPFYYNVRAILNMFLPGQNGGQATYELLYGLANPSGRLAETWLISYEDVPFGDKFGKDIDEIYKESIYVGYRYYLSADKEVRFPFGYGLSYSKFVYSGLKVKKDEDKLTVTLNVKNVSDIDGYEIVQIYVSSPKEKMFKAIRELKGFSKIHLKAKESKNVVIDIELDDLKSWAIKDNRFVLESGEYVVQVGKNSRDIILEKAIEIEAEEINPQFEKDVQNVYENLKFEEITDNLYEKMSGVKIPGVQPKKPITLESRFTDYKLTFMGKILYNSVLATAKKEMKAALKLPEGTERENKIKGALFLKRILDSNSIRSLSMSAGSGLPYNFAEGFRDLANGHLIKGIKDFTTKIKAPSLPDVEEVK